MPRRSAVTSIDSTCRGSEPDQSLRCEPCGGRKCLPWLESQAPHQMRLWQYFKGPDGKEMGCLPYIGGAANTCWAARRSALCPTTGLMHCNTWGLTRSLRQRATELSAEW